MSSKGMLWPFFFEATDIGTAYFTMLQDIIHCLNILFSVGDCYFQHEGVPPHKQTTVRNSLEVHFLRRWTVQRKVWYIHPEPDSAPVHFYLWGKEYCVCRKMKIAAEPEAQKWNCPCSYSTSNNKNLLLSSMPLSTKHWFWWWSFWTFITLI